MAPRGRPPGRKNGSSLGAAQLQTTPKTAPKTAATPATVPTKKTTTTKTATPQAATPQATPVGKKQAAKKGKIGRPSKGTPRSVNATPAAAAAAAAATPATPAPTSEIRVASLSEILANEPVAESIEPADESEAVPMDITTNEQPNGTSHTAEQSVLPDESRIADDKENPIIAADGALSTAPAVSHPTRGRPPNSARVGRHGPLGYTAANVDLDVITYRQLSEDIDAYSVDLDFCTSQLAQDDLSPQEGRTLQLRRLDLSHQIRHCQHRKETLEAQRAIKGGRPLTRAVPNAPRVSTAGTLTTTNGRRPVPSKRPLSSAGFDHNGIGTNGSALGPNKRPRAASEVSLQDTISMHSVGSPAATNGNGNVNGNGAPNDDSRSDIEMVHYTGGGDNSIVGNDSYLAKTEDDDASLTVRRLGFWKCRLCVSEKYLYAGPDRLPNNPSKWPLKDMGKLMSHYFDLHTEHEPEERCVELGDALDDNRGPFEHWLRKSRAQKIPDRSIIDETISELQAGRVPKLLRDLCRAAAAFPGA